MGLVGKRAEFKEALSSVDGVTGYEDAPTPPKAGDAWPVWRGAEREEDGIAFTSTWTVVVALPVDPRVAEQWVDEHIDGLYEAVQPVGYVDSFAISNLSTTDQRYALVLTTRSE